MAVVEVAVVGSPAEAYSHEAASAQVAVPRNQEASVRSVGSRAVVGVQGQSQEDGSPVAPRSHLETAGAVGEGLRVGEGVVHSVFAVPEGGQSYNLRFGVGRRIQGA